MKRTAFCSASTCLWLSTALAAAPSLPVTPPTAATPEATQALGGLTAAGAPMPAPLPQIPPSPLPADLLALAQELPATSASPLITAELPTLAPCRFAGTSVELSFGQVPAGVDARRYERPLMLQVECSQATEFSITAQEPPLSFGTAAERSAIAVTLRGPASTYSGSAWALLEQDGQPLANRRFSVPAASPTLIAINALLLATPEARLTPSLSGELESLVLARQLYLIETSTP